MTEPHSDNTGRTALSHTLQRLGVELGNGDFEKALTRMKHVEDQTGAVSDAQLRAIVDDVVSGAEIFQEVTESFL